MRPDIDIARLIHVKLDEALAARGHATVLVAGRSGVGKSTLINAVFSGHFADTGHGRPVTQSSVEYTKPGVPVSLIDTRGLEMAQFEATLAELESLLVRRQSDPDPNRHVHCAWVCIAEDSRRVEEGERKVVELLSAHAVPVVIVITKARADCGFSSEVRCLLPRARNAIRVMATPEVLDDGIVLKSRGLDDLVEITASLVPESRKTAFIAAQRVSLAQKEMRAHGIVASSAAAAGTAVLTPIPFADAFLIVPIQITMLAGISGAFGLELDRAFLGTLLGSAAGALGTTMAGRALVSGFLKLVPAAGSAAGGAFAAATAMTLTTTLGEIYVVVLSRLLAASHGEMPAYDTVSEAFATALKARVEQTPS